MAEKNIFNEFIEDSGRAEALHLKSYLAALVVALIASKKWNQTEAAKHLDVKQPRISEIKQAKLDKFSVDFLLQLLAKLGYRLELDFNPQKLKKPIKISLVQK